MDRLLPVYISTTHWQILCSLASENKQTPGEFVTAIITSEIDQWLEANKPA